ncbi:ATP phosphoribosyltransferase regulatory subunit [Desulfuromonas thiophila]|uniref:ATP phosphoribosyltransferase regulatory subunit n=1 Tax=Desulfuromonas thiophila TaxID=57664 RepID=A0A1G7A174_9BACT|nr:ATP phosphoribosyltransferase regulatory subunit [Desulfuromonas thiophila]SDE08559.1 histidyl-tRNA synthetase [Desulfuromonas thiophila]
MNLYEPSHEPMIPKGVKDFLPTNAVKIESLRQTLQQVFRLWGFQPVIPPSLEFLSVLERGLGNDLRDRTLRFDDRQSGQLLAFAPDVTPQIARIFATRMTQAELPQRLSYSCRVLRHTEEQAGKDREIFQSGVELIGDPSPRADAEMITMALECLDRLQAPEFTIDIGQVEFYRGVLEGLDLALPQVRAIEQALLHKDSSSLRQLLQQLPLSDGQCEELMALPRLFGGREVLDQASAVVTNERSKQALDDLHQVLHMLELYQVDQHITLDLGELRGLDYYTGVTFQGFLTGFGQAVCLGGRYDHLTERYGRAAAATGFAFNLLHLLFAMPDILGQQAQPLTDVLLCAPPCQDSAMQRLARQLRGQGYSACTLLTEQAPPCDNSLRRQYRYLAHMADDGHQINLLCLADGSSQNLSGTELTRQALGDTAKP